MLDQHAAPICGAANRAGNPCQRRDLHPNGRCRLHGGLSTGPTSAEGKARVAENLAAKPHEPLLEAAPEPAQPERRGVAPRMTWAETVALFERWKAEGKRA